MAIETVDGNSEIRNEILSGNEDQFFDVKHKAIKPAELQKHYVALANTDGGDLYVGILDPEEKGNRIQGFSKPEDSNDHINTILTLTKPAVEGTLVEHINFGSDGYVLHIMVPKSPSVHYTADDACYIRQNASTKQIKGEKITALSHAKGSFSYEKSLLTQPQLKDLIKSPILNSYLSRIKSAQKPKDFLTKNRFAIKQDRQTLPTVASVLLFDESPQSAIDKRCAIKVYRLQTTDVEYKREHLLHEPTTIEGNLENQIEKVIAEVDKLLTGVTFAQKGKTRQHLYPHVALKELLVNAVIHRDYNLNDDIHVRIYDNRIEIQSPGRLPGFMTLKNLLEERYSRNPLIVRALHKLPNPPNMDIGEGLNTAYNELNKAGLVSPLIEELSNAVKVTVQHKRIASLIDVAREHLQENDNITNKVLRALSGEESENKVKKALQKLREEKLIEPVNSNASSFKFEYEITAKGIQELRKKNDAAT